MFYGENTPELEQSRKEYQKVFGYDPNGDMEIEFGQDEYNLYLSTLRKCIDTKKDIFEVLGL